MEETATFSESLKGGTRTACVGGKSIRVPRDMNYADFKAVYVDKTTSLKDWRGKKKSADDDSVLTAPKESNKIKISSALNRRMLTLGLSRTIDAGNVARIADMLRNAPENIRILWNLAQLQRLALGDLQRRNFFVDIERRS